MDKTALRERLNQLSRENTSVFANYMRSNIDLWRSLVRAYLWWHECQMVPDFLDELYAEHKIMVKAKSGNTPNFGPMLRIIFDRAELHHERERIIFWKWGCAVNKLHVEHSDNSQRYRSNAEGKLFQFFSDRGGIDGLTRKEIFDEELLEQEQDTAIVKSSKKPLADRQSKISKGVLARAKAGLVNAEGMGTLNASRPVRVGMDGLIAVLARREPSGQITILGSSNTQSAIDSVSKQLLASDLTHLEHNIRVLAEVIRSQAYPTISMPADLAKRAKWYNTMLLDNSPIKVSDVNAQSDEGKKFLKAPSKLLVRGAQGDVVLSGTKTHVSVVTSCRPAKPLIDANDQVFLRVMERSVIERMLDTGEIHLLKVSPKTGLKPASADAKYTYQLSLDNGISNKAQTLHFYDAKQKAGMLTGFQVGFEFDDWSPDWKFSVEPIWFAKMREQMLDEWFSSFGAGKQPKRTSNLIMQAMVTGTTFGLKFNMHDEESAPQRYFDAKVEFKATSQTYQTNHLSKDIAPVLYNLADVHSDGLVEVSGNSGAMVFAYKNDLGSFATAVPTAQRKKKAAVRKSLAFSEIRYG